MRITQLILFFFLFASVGLEAKSYQAKAVAVYDVKNSIFLYKKNSRTQRAPASTIKVLTALTAWKESSDIQKWVRISNRAAKTQPTKAGLRSGEKFRLIDLIKAALVNSCNDAAVAIGEGVAGSESAFARKMQSMAESLGCRSTRVTNPSGLPHPTGMVSTCEDSLKMILALRKNPTLKKMLALRSLSIVSADGRRIHLKSHNRLLSPSYPHAVRGKTGYTRLARHCFLSFCEYKGGVLAISIMGSPNRNQLWEDVVAAYADHFSSSKGFFPRYMNQKKLTISQLHKALKNAGFPLDSREKHYGKKTVQSVKKFQEANRLTVDGIAGPQTWNALKKYTKS